MRTLGCDVSKWQKQIDWARVVETGLRFAIIKASQALRVDPWFHRNWGGAGAVDIVRGAYHLAELDDDIPAQAEHYLELVRPGPGDLLALDIETGKIEEVAPSRAHEGILEWLETVERACGKSPLLYISPRGVKKLRGLSEGLPRFPLWDVDYESTLKNGVPIKTEPDMPTGWDTWVMWQFTSDGGGKQHGMESNGLDLNLFNGTVEELKAFSQAGVVPGGRGPFLTEAEVQQALGYNDAQGYGLDTAQGIIRVVGANPWDEQDIARAIARWQHEHDGKAGAKTIAELGLDT